MAEYSNYDWLEPWLKRQGYETPPPLARGGLNDYLPYSQGWGAMPGQYSGVTTPLPPGYGADNYSAANPQSLGAADYLRSMIAMGGAALDNADPSQNTYMQPEGRGPTNYAAQQMGILGMPYAAFAGRNRR
jgi:hypothetical protein